MIQALVPAVTGLLDKFIEDKDQKNQIAHEIATLAEKQAHEEVMGQLAVNRASAQHRSVFVAGARPFILWVCGVAMAYHFVLAPLILFGASFAGAEIPELPTFDMDSLMTVLLGILGLSGMRSYEKKQGLTR